MTCFMCGGKAKHWIIAVLVRAFDDRDFTGHVDFNTCDTHKISRAKILGDDDKERGWKVSAYSAHGLTA